MGSETPVVDHVARARRRLLAQYKGDAVVQAISDVLAREVQDLEDAIWTILDRFWLDDAEGVQLDWIGKIVGERRAYGLTDDPYRARIRIRIARNMSEGRIEDVVAIYGAMTGAARVELLEYGVAAFIITAYGANPIYSEAEIAEALMGAKAAAVGIGGAISSLNPFSFYGDPEGSGFASTALPDEGGELSGGVI